MGVLVPPLLRGVVRPLPGIDDTAGDFHAKLQTGSPRHGFTYDYTGKPGTYLAICTQTCDIASDEESVVEAILVKKVADPKVLAQMRQSTRRFVLDETRGLIAVSHIKTFIDKRFLLEVTPQPGCKDQATQRAFAHWIGGRYLRAAHPDAYVEGVRRPILAKFDELRTTGDPLMSSVDSCRLRVFPPENELSPPPYDVGLLFVMPDGATEGTAQAVDIRADLASVAARIQGALDPSIVSNFDWYANPLIEMSAADFLDSDAI